MSANLLEKVTQGERMVGRPVKPYGIAVYGRDGLKDVRICRGVVSQADADLIALAYDHALWGAAVATGRAKWQPKMQNVALLSIIKPPQPSDVSDEDYADAGGRGWRPQILRAFPTTLDAFGCPALTPELRDALKKALGLVVA